MRHVISLAFAGALIAGGANAVTLPAKFTGHELAAHAKISLAEARKLALKARPGKITDQELEKERGGSGLRFSFDVASRGRTVEVGIDAVTGKVLENGAESPAKEAREEAHEGARPK